MKTLHAKSPCCGAKVIRYGKRRWQCTQCQTTWRRRKKKSGRKRIRSSINLLARFFDHAIGSSQARAKHQHFGVRTFQRQLERSRDLFRRTHEWPPLPAQCPLILIADAMVKCIRGRWYTVYFMLIRTVQDTNAWIAPPILLPGKEYLTEWMHALNSLPAHVSTNITALVCDGSGGLLNYAKDRHWLVQRCHFHLIAAIQGRRSQWGKSRHRTEGQLVYQAVKEVLEAPTSCDITPLLYRIDDVALSTSSPQLRRVLRGFVNHVADFRTYLHHPELNLPRTSNTAESLVGCVEELLHRLRGVSNINSLEKWIEAFVKYKGKIVCNAAYQPEY